MPTKEEKSTALATAVSITKEYARGGGSVSPEIVLERLYQKILPIIEDSKK